MQTYNSLFRKKLESLIEEEIKRITENLALGLSVNDISDYRKLVGTLDGLKKSLELCEEAQTIVDKQ